MITLFYRNLTGKTFNLIRSGLYPTLSRSYSDPCNTNNNKGEGDGTDATNKDPNKVCIETNGREPLESDLTQNIAQKYDMIGICDEKDAAKTVDKTTATKDATAEKHGATKKEEAKTTKDATAERYGEGVKVTSFDCSGTWKSDSGSGNEKESGSGSVSGSGSGSENAESEKKSWQLSPDVEKALNKQINKELLAAYGYEILRVFFENQTVSLSGFSQLQKAQAAEELGHARLLIQCVLDRGGNVEFSPLNPPEPQTWKTPLEALKSALGWEDDVYQGLQEVHKLATAAGDFYTCSVITNKILGEGEPCFSPLLKHIQMLETAKDPSTVFMLDMLLQKMFKNGNENDKSTTKIKISKYLPE